MLVIFIMQIPKAGKVVSSVFNDEETSDDLAPPKPDFLPCYSTLSWPAYHPAGGDTGCQLVSGKMWLSIFPVRMQESRQKTPLDGREHQELMVFNGKP